MQPHVHRQHSSDKLGRLKKGVFLAHRSVHRSEDETAFNLAKESGREGRQGHPPGDELKLSKSHARSNRAGFEAEAERLAADTAYGTGRFLGWLVDFKIPRRIPVRDASERDGSYYLSQRLSLE